MPTRLDFAVSKDGKDFEEAYFITINFPERLMAHTIKEFSGSVDLKDVRFVRVKAKNFGTIPEWHPGAGFQAYIFVDEIIIE